MRLNFKTSGDDSITKLVAEASRCVKCGRCLSVCPVYRETRREPDVTRGKLSLIESIPTGEIHSSSKLLKEIISLCLLCGSCAENCPNLVTGDAIIQKAREVLTLNPNLPQPYKFVLSHILPYPKRMERAHKARKIFQPFFMKKIPRESGLHLRFPRLRDQKHRLIPDLADEPFLKKHFQEKSPEDPSIALFVGCVSNYLFPHIAEAVLNIFRDLKVSVFIPQEQTCCGLIAFGNGIGELYRRVAQKNIEVFESVDSIPVVAFCSSCSWQLKNYPELFKEKEWKSRALGFSQRVKDFSELLVEAGFKSQPEDNSKKSSFRLTFHDPCHLRRKQGIFVQPRHLLMSVKGVEFIETGEENLCCGSGGSFNLSHYNISLKIFRRRLSSIKKAGVDTVVTSCMGCLLQFLDGLYQEGKSIRIKHLAEILGKSFPPRSQIC
jgi:glycolate oxidase iron-sulfur subunit